MSVRSQLQPKEANTRLYNGAAAYSSATDINLPNHFYQPFAAAIRLTADLKKPRILRGYGFCFVPKADTTDKKRHPKVQLILMLSKYLRF
jgi:hypothetical protein